MRLTFYGCQKVLLQKATVLFILLFFTFSAFSFSTTPPSTLAASLNQYSLTLFSELNEKNQTSLLAPIPIYLNQLSLCTHAKELPELDIAYKQPEEQAKNLHNILNLIQPFSAFFKWSNSTWIQQTNQDKPALPIQDFPAFHVDFKQSQALSAAVMNHWIKKASKNHFTTLIKQKQNNSQLILEQISTAYFHNQWLFPFNSNETKPGLFNTEKEIQEPALMMQQKHYFPFYKEKDFSMVVLPYKNDTFSLILVLPSKSNHTTQWLKQLTSRKLHSYLIHSRYSMVDLTLPKTKLETIITPTHLHKRSQAKDAAYEDLSALLCTPKHAIYTAGFSLSFTESGTNEKRATVKPLKQAILSQRKPIAFHANKPFAFILIEQQTESILMLGTVHSVTGVASWVDTGYT